MKVFLFLVSVLLLPAVQADSAAHDYDYVARKLFWNELYAYGGWTLYCGYRFTNNKEKFLTGWWRYSISTRRSRCCMKPAARVACNAVRREINDLSGWKRICITCIR